MSLPDLRHSWLAVLTVASIVIASVLALVSPDATRGLGFAARLVFWLAHVAVPLALAQGLTQAVMRTGALQSWPAIVAGGVMASVAFAPLAALIDALAFGERMAPASITGEISALVVPVALVWTALNGLRFLRLSDGPDPKSDGAVPDFQRRLRPDLRGRVLALSSELHYVRVYTEAGEDLILCPLARAVDEMPPGAGLRLHRSHWAARDAILRIDRDGSAGRAVLRNGITMPVARSRLAEIRAAL